MSPCSLLLLSPFSKILMGSNIFFLTFLVVKENKDLQQCFPSNTKGLCGKYRLKLLTASEKVQQTFWL